MVENNSELNNSTQLHIVEGLETVDPEQIKKSVSFYENYRLIADKDLKIGLYGHDVEDAITDPRSVLIRYETNDNQSLYAPLLVPIDKLEWYNRKVLEQTYGVGAKLFYYAHPPIDGDIEEVALTNLLREYIEAGYVIFSDRYNDEPHSARPLIKLGSDYQLKKLGTSEVQSGVEVFTAEVRQLEAKGIFNVPALHEVYERMKSSGELVVDETDGVALAQTIAGEEAERIWEIYQLPFEKLGENHPTYAGFDKAGLTQLLADPEVVKVVKRVDGRISTLCIFVQNFGHCPWFNREHYKKEYPEYYSTNNILIFPGIVTDPSMKGQRYSFDVIDLANRLLAKRGSDFLITFECTETSATYIPNIVQGAVEASGYSEVHGLESPTTKIDYIGVSKNN